MPYISVSSKKNPKITIKKITFLTITRVLL